jgi:hypothetical protein
MRPAALADQIEERTVIKAGEFFECRCHSAGFSNRPKQSSQPDGCPPKSARSKMRGETRSAFLYVSSVFAGNGAETGTVFVIDDPLMKVFRHKPDSVWLSGRIPFLTRGFGISSLVHFGNRSRQDMRTPFAADYFLEMAICPLEIWTTSRSSWGNSNSSQ